MKKLYTFSIWERAQAWMLKEILAKEGIDCVLRNEQLSTAMGEIPFVECYPELWVIDDEVYPRARLLVEGLLSTSGQDAAEAWICRHCGERLEGHFGACWLCGHERQEE
ncbi:MAG: DUF2007 domain-containing protein [Desulfuromonadales bacterium]|nr:DUF2007 domain-containing protein [Desulfuromonadales bacterium]NIR33225.1 DUF2007 domain-containing protein [Desulfuromonadales bacterium]NIS40729.1 DUF2007 domain-containing protein [Desulfuromonadales bacterium]